MTDRRVLVVTVVHRPDDARILHRQVAALLDAGWAVTYAAPWGATGTPPPATTGPAVAAVDLPRAVGRRRLPALRAARAVLAAHGPSHDVVLLHDPELLLALPGLRLPPVVWDVHEDAAAALGDRAWVPGWARPLLRRGVRAAERWAERRCATLLLAEHGYASRFRRELPVVPNVPRVPPAPPPPPGDDRVVYVGRLSTSRGVHELVALGAALAGEVTVELVGPADAEVVDVLDAADAAGHVAWAGFVPNDDALARLDGALAGLSLLRDEPNFRSSMPTKVLEYLAHGLPVVTTPLPEAVAVVAGGRVGAVVGFGDVTAAAAAVRALAADPDGRAAMGRRGHELAAAAHDWTVHGPAFVAVLDEVAGG